ncbi:MAG TPA: hypothetical protein VMR92_04955, partial [Gemmatimonadales bacterium]|nr:hypothetical protein [Gemmatimonadales bacterium]
PISPRLTYDPTLKELYMTTDRITKVWLGTIALGLWMNVVDHWIRPAHLAAADADSTVIMRDVHSIATGSCSNKHIC